MRILFTSAQLPGHLDWGGYLATAALMAQRGHTVRWASGAAVEQQVRASGVPFRRLVETGWRWPPPPPLPPADAGDAAWQQLRRLRALDQWLDETRVAVAVDELAAVAQEFKPDLIAGETFMAAAGIVAEMAGTPFVVVGWPARASGATATDALVAEAHSRLERLLRRVGAQGAYWSTEGAPALRSPQLHLTYWSPTWYSGIPLSAQTQHCGGRTPPASPPDASLPSPDKRPWVLITLGTSFNEDPNFFLAAAHAAEQTGCLPLVVLGKTLAAESNATWRQRLPAAAAIRPFVRFGAVLPYTAAAIHHGGAGATHALVTHAVPQVVVPHAAEQMHQAGGVVRSGVGFHIAPRQVTVDVLRQALAALLPDLAAERQQAQHLQAEFDALGGIERAADLLESMV